MPPGNTDSIAPDTKLDILAFLLRENGFPAGPTELSASTEVLDGLQIVKQGAEAGAPNFSLVQIVGCLTPDATNGWKLTNATEPVVTRDNVPSPAALTSAGAKALGKQTFGLVSVDAAAKSGQWNGQKVEVRGLLYRDGSYADVNLTSVRGVGGSCSN
jgi:hypothetical protein